MQMTAPTIALQGWVSANKYCTELSLSKTIHLQLHLTDKQKSINHLSQQWQWSAELANARKIVSSWEETGEVATREVKKKVRNLNTTKVTQNTSHSQW